MPWTTDGVVYHQTIGQRPAVMCACRADCEHLVPAAHQQHLPVAAMTDELAAIGEVKKRDAFNEIRSVLAFSHCSFSLGDLVENRPLRLEARASDSLCRHLRLVCRVPAMSFEPGGAASNRVSDRFGHHANEFNRQLRATFMLTPNYARVIGSSALSSSNPREKLRASYP